ncbi:MAG: Dyp-type peroxidase [Gammaproteobacteria bacterium]|nr:Dyp-type peroxidase [Gammaproteobacteria bacterium]
MDNIQVGILSDIPNHARYMTFNLLPHSNIQKALQILKSIVDGKNIVAGLGSPLLKQSGKKVSGMRDFTAHSGPGLSLPSTISALWLWLRGEDKGELFHLAREAEIKLSDYFQLEATIEAFQYKDSRDLTGYEDGTENPTGEDAIHAGIVRNQGEGLDGSSFVAVQKWLHEMKLFNAMSTSEQDDTFGRRISDNEEIDEAPESAHVKRTAQESFSPEAFILRRSMPWTDEQSGGLVFVAFGHSFDAFEALLKRMLGDEDNITDALFNFTRPISGAYFWCPPMKNNQLDLRAIE